MQISPYQFDSQDVRIVQDDESGELLFVASDVCRALGITKPENAYSRLEDDEKDTRTIGTHGGPQQMIVINESGLYSLIFGSRKTTAKVFRRWVTHEVIPSIRRTGAYSTNETALTSPKPKPKAKAKAPALAAPQLSADWLAKSMSSAQRLLQLAEGRVGMVDISEQLREFSHPDVAMGMAAILLTRQRFLVEMQSLESAHLRVLSPNEHIVDVGAEKWADHFVAKMTRAQVVELAQAATRKLA
jgi:prophage antirepressor-like protein